MDEGEVSVLQPLDIAEHLVFGVIAVEHVLGQVLARPNQFFGKRRGNGAPQRRLVERHRLTSRKTLQEDDDFLHRRQFVQGNADRRIIESAEVQVPLIGAGHDAVRRQRRGLSTGCDANGVEEGLRRHLVTQPVQSFRQVDRQAVNALGDPAEAFRAVVDGIHARHHGQQHLGGANVARRLVAADVLLPRLQCQAIGCFAVGIPRNTHEAAGQLAHVIGLAGEKGRMGAAEPQRDAEALRGADGNVCTDFARRTQQRERQEICGYHHQDARGVGLVDQGRVVANAAVRRRGLQQETENLILHAGKERVGLAHV